jgi:hypothetical protein
MVWGNLSQDRGTFESQVYFAGTWLEILHSQEIFSTFRKRKLVLERIQRMSMREDSGGLWGYFPYLTRNLGAIFGFK